jgi:hypothetical protein
MNLKTLTLIVNSLIGLFLVIGFVWGIKRGVLKSSLRLGFLIFNCIFWLIATPTVANFIFNANISSLFSLNAGGQTFTTLNSFLTYIVNNNQTVLQFAGNNPVIAPFIEQVPIVATNFIVFMLGYFMLKTITFPLYAWVANKITSKIKQKRANYPEKNYKDYIFGAFLGLLQGALTGMILFLPISTLSIVFSNTASANVANTNNSNLAAMSYTQTNNEQYETSQETQNEFSSDEDLKNFLNIYYDTLLSSTLRAMNLNQLNELIFTQLSSVKINGVKVSLASEVKTATEAAVSLNNVLSTHDVLKLDEISQTEWLKIIAEVDYEKLETLVDKLFSLKSLSVAGDDILGFVYNEVLKEAKSVDEFIDPMPNQAEELLDNVLLAFKTSNLEMLKQDIFDTLQVVKTLQKHNLLDFAKDQELIEKIQNNIEVQDESVKQEIVNDIIINTINALQPYSEETIKNDITRVIFGSNTMRRLMPDVTNMLVNTLNSTLDTNFNDNYDFNVSWYNESENIAKIIYNAKEIANNALPLLNSNEQYQFNKDEISKLPLTKIGTILNTLRQSQLFSHIYYDSAKELLPIFENNNGYNNEEYKLEYINLQTTNWETELKNIQDSSVTLLNEFDKINNQNYQDVNINVLQDEIVTMFNNDIVKESLMLSSELLAENAVNYIQDNLNSDTDNSLLITTAKTLQEMTAIDIQNDILAFVSAIESLEVLQSKDPDLEKLEYSNINNALNNILKSELGENLLPEVINFGIDKINLQLNTDINYINTNTVIRSRDIEKISKAIHNLVTVYTQLEKLDIDINNLDNFSIENLEYLKQVDIEKIGESLDLIKNTRYFSYIYPQVVSEIIFNENTLGSVLEEDLMSQIMLNSTQVRQIDWSEEFSAVKNGVSIFQNILNFESNKTTPISLTEFLQEYGDNTLLKLAFVGGLKHTFPHANVNTIKQVNLQNSAYSLSAVAESFYLYEDFKHNGLLQIETIKKYHIREGFKAIDDNANLVNLLEELSGVKNVSFNELSPVLFVAYDLLEGEQASIKKLGPYFEVAHIIPWILELVERFAKGYKLPYYLNAYMRVDLFNTRIKLHSLHLGKQVNEKKEPIQTEDVLNLIKKLSYVPNFITIQFKYDSTFTQPSLS